MPGILSLPAEILVNILREVEDWSLLTLDDHLHPPNARLLEMRLVCREFANLVQPAAWALNLDSRRDATWLQSGAWRKERIRTLSLSDMGLVTLSKSLEDDARREARALLKESPWLSSLS